MFPKMRMFSIKTIFKFFSGIFKTLSNKFILSAVIYHYIFTTIFSISFIIRAQICSSKLTWTPILEEHFGRNKQMHVSD